MGLNGYCEESHWLDTTFHGDGINFSANTLEIP